MAARTSADVKAARKRVGTYLASKIVHAGSVTEEFIPYDEIERAWTGHDVIEAVLCVAELSTDGLERIRKNFLRVLSILIWINGTECLDDIGNRMVEGRDLPFKDTGLPAGLDSLKWLEDPLLRPKFQSLQHIFVPATLCESSEVQDINKDCRLPFQEISEDVSSGAYGVVDKVTIAPFHFFTRHEEHTNQGPKIVACKKYHSASSLARHDIERELYNLQLLKESSTSHEHILIHLTIVHHRGRHLILLPWADRHDLDHFLREGKDHTAKQIYDFDKWFPGVLADPRTTLESICRQMRHIADALKWLHEGILTHRANRNRVYFAHMDLKPDNVLIKRDDISSGPSKVGKWILCDFGLSAFKKDDQLNTTQFSSMQDYFERDLSMNTPARRAPGAYQPPEVGGPESDNITTLTGAGRGGDIWAFGCVLAEVLAFSIGGSSFVHDFRKARKGVHKTDYFYEKRANLVASSAHIKKTYQVRPGIVKWLRELVGTASLPKTLVSCCVETILQLLETDRESRPKSSEVQM
ncbi:kinase-like domain-containing protein [Pyrenochaeta sp. MPI-SDFR-AT-0127]|nr:kinase-like domain-containing protein [Pyrenochaeta sp. MPI-SDFR-AT-0127]